MTRLNGSAQEQMKLVSDCERDDLFGLEQWVRRVGDDAAHIPDGTRQGVQLQVMDRPKVSPYGLVGSPSLIHSTTTYRTIPISIAPGFKAEERRMLAENIMREELNI